MGLEFVLAGQAKFTRSDYWSEKFESWQLPDPSYLIIGGLEVIGGVAIFFPKLASKAALGLGAIMLVATGFHLIHQEWDRAPITSILLTLLVITYWLRKKTGKWL